MTRNRQYFTIYQGKDVSYPLSVQEQKLWYWEPKDYDGSQGIWSEGHKTPEEAFDEAMRAQENNDFEF